MESLAAALTPLTSSTFPIAVSALILVLCLFWSSFTRFTAKLQLWSRQGIPTPNSLIFYFTSMFVVLSSDFMTLDLRRIRKYGKVFGYADGSRSNLLVGDPEMLKDMLIRHFSSFVDRRPTLEHAVISKQLVLMSGEEWRRTRTIMSPTFTSGKMKSMFPMIKEAVSLMTDRIDKGSGQEFDLKNLFGCLTMDVIAKCAFAVDSNAHVDESNAFVSNARGFFHFPRWRVLLAFVLPRTLRSALRISFFNPKPLMFLDKLARGMIQERRKLRKEGKQTNDYTDFLQLMLDAGTKEESDKGEIPDEDLQLEDQSGSGNAGGKKTLTDDEIVANVILVLVAGYETTASLLTYSCYSLACNPEMQQRLREEVLRAGELDYETISRLPYLDAVISESLRMYPPVLRTDRQVSNRDGYTYESGERKIHMPHGSAVVLPIYAIHHMEEYYPNPETFDPERFMPANKDKLVPYTWLPFVMGPRNCIGMRFALLEAKLTLATLVANYRFTPTSQTDVPLNFSKTVVLLNPKRVVVAIEKNSSK